jgi:ABC-type multidrug transport system ATPase subunit
MTERFKLMRCGLISLFHYANQVFDAEDGHLLLRGSNGSGKSTAMELIVPLLFDGNLSASNLSTSDGQRSIAYHLLLDGLYPRRLGYAWIQFACGDRWVTLALGV